ncbi:hypothetical protein N7461_004687 [Penicillium sp. DV-2018c]|nr:hypothetical protein N7461_004687 [Penicillium sp. DV-2018c]
MAPVKHGCFSFDNDTLFVTTPDGYTHTRANRAHIARIFVSRIRVQYPIPDYPGHWYRAQVLHYGLAPTKDPALAKMRLQEALQDMLLRVPNEVRQIEDRLRSQWFAMNLPEADVPAPAPRPPSRTGIWAASLNSGLGRPVFALARQSSDRTGISAATSNTGSERPVPAPVPQTSNPTGIWAATLTTGLRATVPMKRAAEDDEEFDAARNGRGQFRRRSATPASPCKGADEVSTDTSMRDTSAPPGTTSPRTAYCRVSVSESSRIHHIDCSMLT